LTLDGMYGIVNSNTDDSKQSQRNHTVIAEKIMKDYRFRTLRDTEEILVNQNGVFKYGAEPLIKEECEKRVTNCTSYIRNEVIKTIQVSTYADRSDFDRNSDIINVKNGLLNIRTGEFTEHDENILTRVQLPVNYNPKAGPVKVIKFLMECLPDTRDRLTVIEEAAYTLLRDLKLEKLFMHLGTGSNGKSTLFYLLEALLGQDNISHVTIHDLIYNRFSKARLDAKLANIFADIEDDELRRIGIIKALISGDPIDAEKKGKDPFTLRSYAKLIFSTNQLPEINEDTDAVFRRFIITEWVRKFEGEEKNPELRNELTSDEELSGFLNLLLFHAKRLLRNKRFSYEQSTEQLRREWKEKADPVTLFSKACLVEDVSALASREQVYATYAVWCKRNKIIPRNNRAFNKKLQKIANVEPTEVKIHRKTTKVWKGISLQENNKVTEVTSSDHSKSKENKQGTLF